MPKTAMQYVFQLNADRSPMPMLPPSEARKLMKAGKCAVLKQFPFTVIHRQQQPALLHPEYRLKIDPGAKFTGLALLEGDRVIWAAELEHRGFIIKANLESRRAIRRSRRQRKTRYRAPRFNNRTREDRWIPPSLRSRVENVRAWVNRLISLCPITAFSMESVRFDMQKILNPEISGVEYQQGELQGYEVREYLLEKWHRQCAYCNAKNVPLQVEHIHPRSKGGTDRVSNLTIACEPCNQRKGNKPVEEFLKSKPDVLKRVLAQSKAPLRDAAAVNVTRRYLYRVLAEQGLTIECGSGGRTKRNRVKLGLPKTHWLDAACVGESTPESLKVEPIKPLLIKATGYGNRQMMQTDKYGFPKGSPRMRVKRFMGFKTGDFVVASIPNGKYAGKIVGRVTIRSRPHFRVGKVDTHPRNLTLIHRMDGYSYSEGSLLK